MSDKMREALNLLCIDGDLNTTFDLMQESNSPDAKFNLLGAFAAVAIGKYSALSQSEPAQVSQPVAEICSGFALHWVGSGAIAPIIEKHNLKVGDKLFSSPPDYEALKAQLVRSEADNTRLQSQYDEMRLKCSRRPAVAENEALKAENTLLKEVEKSFADLSENLQNDCAALKLRVAELEAATEHLGLTPQQAKDGLSRHKALVAERDRLQSDKANLIQQAEIQAQEARTMKSIVIGILTDLDLPQKDYDARSNIAQKFSRLQSECGSLRKLLGDEAIKSMQEQAK